jgi:hypothetical protein
MSKSRYNPPFTGLAEDNPDWDWWKQETKRRGVRAGQRIKKGATVARKHGKAAAKETGRRARHAADLTAWAARDQAAAGQIRRLEGCATSLGFDPDFVPSPGNHAIHEARGVRRRNAARKPQLANYNPSEQCSFCGKMFPVRELQTLDGAWVCLPCYDKAKGITRDCLGHQLLGNPRARDNFFWGKRKETTPAVPRVSVEEALERARILAAGRPLKRNEYYLVKMPKKGRRPGVVWYFVSSLGDRALERLSENSLPKSYIDAADPWPDVYNNLASHRSSEDYSVVLLDALASKLGGVYTYEHVARTVQAKARANPSDVAELKRKLYAFGESLGAWNLKYHQFPDISDWLDKNWSAAAGREAAEAYLSGIMRKRSSSYYGQSIRSRGAIADEAEQNRRMRAVFADLSGDEFTRSKSNPRARRNSGSLPTQTRKWTRRVRPVGPDHDANTFWDYRAPPRWGSTTVLTVYLVDGTWFVTSTSFFHENDEPQAEHRQVKYLVRTGPRASRTGRGGCIAALDSVHDVVALVGYRAGTECLAAYQPQSLSQAKSLALESLDWDYRQGPKARAGEAPRKNPRARENWAGAAAKIAIQLALPIAKELGVQQWQALMRMGDQERADWLFNTAKKASWLGGPAGRIGFGSWPDAAQKSMFRRVAVAMKSPEVQQAALKAAQDGAGVARGVSGKAAANPKRRHRGPKKAYTVEVIPASPRIVGAIYTLFPQETGAFALKKIRNSRLLGRFEEALPGGISARSSAAALEEAEALTAESRGGLLRASRGGFTERTGRISAGTSAHFAAISARAELLEQMAYLMQTYHPLTGFQAGRTGPVQLKTGLQIRFLGR